MARASRGQGSRFTTYFAPVLDALRALGGSGRPREVLGWIRENRDIPDSEFETLHKDGMSRIEKDVAFARFYLAKAGLVAAEKHGIWLLTASGEATDMDSAKARELVRSVQSRFRKAPKAPAEVGVPSGSASTHSAHDLDDEETIDQDINESKGYLGEQQTREELISIFRNMTDQGFERFCALFLRQFGFELVENTGRSGDMGIDGVGYLIINEFVRTRIVFQCKRYEKAVGPEKVRDFRGAIQGRAERGILLTTGTFTKGARDEAGRDNATPIELVDIDRMLDFMIDKQIGLIERRALVIDRVYFDPFLTKRLNRADR